VDEDVNFAIEVVGDEDGDTVRYGIGPALLGRLVNGIVKGGEQLVHG